MSRTSESAPLQGGRRWSDLRSGRFWAVVLGGCTVLGLLEGVQVHIAFTAAGRQAAWGPAFLSTMPSWYVLAALLPGAILLSRRFPLEAGAWRASVPVHLLAGALFSVTHLVLSSYISNALVEGAPPANPMASLSRLFGFYFVVSMVFYWSIVVVYHAIEYARRFRERERAAGQLALKASRLEASLARSNLESLRMQLNPHFLFNTLNAISVMALKGEKHTVVRTLALLSDLLRTSLERSEQLVPLRDEVSFVQRYLEIEQTRFQDRLTTRIDVPADLLDAEVPSLLLQPLVENAIRHGIARKAGAGHIDIRAARAGDRLELVVQDDGPGIREGSAQGGMGIGLANTRDRLEQLYGAGTTLELDNAPAGGARARVLLPLRITPGEIIEHRDRRGVRTA